MPNTFKSSFFNLGTTADTNLYNVPTGTTTLVKSLYFANTGTSGSVSVNLSVGATGATAAYVIRNAILPLQTALQPITEPIVLEANDRLNVQVNTSNVVDVVLSYLEIT
jgi:hypothetical protein